MIICGETTSTSASNVLFDFRYSLISLLGSNDLIRKSREGHGKNWTHLGGKTYPYGSDHQAQRVDPGISRIKRNIKKGVANCFSIDDQGVVYFGNRLVVPKVRNLRQLILKEAHESPLTIHPGSTKMYQDLRQRFWWTTMKREIAQYIANCDVCRRVKAEHQRPAGTL